MPTITFQPHTRRRPFNLSPPVERTSRHDKLRPRPLRTLQLSKSSRAQITPDRPIGPSPVGCGTRVTREESLPAKPRPPGIIHYDRSIRRSDRFSAGFCPRWSALELLISSWWGGHEPISHSGVRSSTDPVTDTPCYPRIRIRRLICCFTAQFMDASTRKSKEIT